MGWGSQNDPQIVAFEQGIRGQARELRKRLQLPDRQPPPPQPQGHLLVLLEGRRRTTATSATRSASSGKASASSRSPPGTPSSPSAAAAPGHKPDTFADDDSTYGDDRRQRWVSRSVGEAADRRARPHSGEEPAANRAVAVPGQPSPAAPLRQAASLEKGSPGLRAQAPVETGTFLGDMLAAMRDDFDSLTSIELSEELHSRAKRRFAGDPKITLLHGDSKACGTDRPLDRPADPVLAGCALLRRLA